MEYINQVKAFYDELEINPLGTPAISLWHALMHICYKAGCPKEFTVAASVLCLKSGLKERTIFEARNELKTKGYLTFKSRGGSRSACYSLRCLYASHADKSNLYALNADISADNPAYNPADKSVALDTNKEDNNNTTNPHNFYYENFGQASRFIDEDITKWSEDLSDELVIEAMKRGLKQNKRTWGYTESILRDWVGKGIKTIADAVNEERLFQERLKIKKGGVVDEKHPGNNKELSGHNFGF